MKAEHRKELQTNLLADRMGRILQGVKGRPSRRGLLLTVLLVIVGVAALVAWFIWQGSINANSERWREFDQMSDFPALKTLADEFPSTQQGKSARMQMAWIFLWELGIKEIGRKPAEAFRFITLAKEKYEELKVECKDDKILGAEALYGIAVAEESLAGNAKTDLKEQLGRASTAYKEVYDTYPKTAYAVKAEKRYEELESKEERPRIENFYHAVRLDVGRFFQMHDPMMNFPKK